MSELHPFLLSALSLGSAGGQRLAELQPGTNPTFSVWRHGRSEWQSLTCLFTLLWSKIPVHHTDIKCIAVFLDVDPTLLNPPASCMHVLCEGHGVQGTGKSDTL